MFRKISFKAVGLGFLVDFVGSLVVGIVVGIIYGVAKARQGLNSAQIQALMSSDSAILIISLIVGFTFTMLGGFVAAKKAKDAPVLNAAMVGVVGVILGVFFHGSYPFWFNSTGFVATIPMAMLGGYLARRK